MTPLTIAVDFDNTLFYMNPDKEIVGEPITHHIKALQQLYGMGHTIYIFSGRPAEQILPVLQQYNIPVHRVNDVVLDASKEFYELPNSKKPHYDILLDDKALNPWWFDTTDELVQNVLNMGDIVKRTNGIMGALKCGS
jgi:hydroxymethylpyrimidine pyrophosphatase-like HAD family hydrolase